jgi:flagella basal body P-ring formation protein FlgA
MTRAIGLPVTTLASTVIAVLGIALAGTAAAASAAGAEELLLARLHERYPLITRWEIKPFTVRVAEAPSDGEASIVTLGPRSAVRIGTRLRWFAIAGFRSVATTKHAIAAGEKLGVEAAALEERNVLGARCEPIVDTGVLEGQRTIKPLRAGELICANMIEPQPSVVRGEMVSVRYLGDRVVLVTKAIAQVDGWPGEEVLVRNPQSRGAFRALVSGVGEVTIHE